MKRTHNFCVVGLAMKGTTWDAYENILTLKSKSSGREYANYLRVTCPPQYISAYDNIGIYSY